MRNKLFGIDVWTEDGYVIRGTWKGRPVYPYRRTKEGGWTSCKVKLATMRRHPDKYDMK